MLLGTTFRQFFVKTEGQKKHEALLLKCILVECQVRRLRRSICDLKFTQRINSSSMPHSREEGQGHQLSTLWVLTNNTRLGCIKQRLRSIARHIVTFLCSRSCDSRFTVLLELTGCEQPAGHELSQQLRLCRPWIAIYLTIVRYELRVVSYRPGRNLVNV